jgi:UDP-N-acetylmuramoyl-tripeptide--D-alanyl-D-alanine ligase
MEISELYKIYNVNPIICTDTRKIKEEGIFFALKGKNFNGHNFANQAINDGCRFAIIDEKEYCTNDKFIFVKNALETLQDLAKHHRKQLSIPVIGITGTNGKTTSKELIHAVLRSELNVYATKGNLNNHIGVPLSVLEITNNHEIAIIEMGANHKNEIRFLCDIANPTHGVITNIGSAHLEGFKSIQGVIDTKNELFNFIKENNGSLFLNDDDDVLVRLAKNIKKTSYGLGSNLNTSISSNTPFLNVIWDKTVIKSRLIGDYQFYNIALAICIGDYFNISKENIQLAIESYIPQNNRSQITETESNVIIMDAYNANPSSMKAMLASFAKQDYKNKLCILGDMLEMGDFSNNEHAKIIKTCQKLKLDTLFVGEEFSKLSNKAFKHLIDLKKFITQHPIKNKTILLKGSRGIGLEGLVSSL